MIDQIYYELMAIEESKKEGRKLVKESMKILEECLNDKRL